MKQLLSVFLFLGFGLLSNAQGTKTNELVSFNTVKHSFGKIKQNVPVTYVFELKNNGSKPLIIEQATAQCGCTTPDYTKKPIMKSKSAPIKVTFNAANPGPFTKTVTVKFLNIPEPSILTIEGEVVGK
ncbi:MAG: DUF1573 domain-containing protein [Chitinophagaceae bacterium]|nr:DUF1573 domain-containing protein [Chitinophagaceae bacterium]